jgi:hypothetical protein
MLGSNILEIAIGLIFIYLLYSILATTIQEGVSAILALRGKMLQKAIKRMLDDGVHDPKSIWALIGMHLKNAGIFLWHQFLFIVPIRKRINTNAGQLVDKFYDHPGIKYLAEGSVQRKPSYISSAYFSKAVVDVLKDMSGKTDTEHSAFDKLGKGIEQVSNLDETKKLLQSYYHEAEGDIEKFKLHLEAWFNETMDRTSGWYKRQIQIIILVIGFILAITFNIDTIQIVHNLSRDKAARKELVDLAVNSQSKFGDSISLKKLPGSTTKDADSLYRYTQELLQNDINNANCLLGLGWDIPQTSDTSCIVENRFSHLKESTVCKGCLASIKCESQPKPLSHFEKARYVLCVSFSSGRKLIGFFITALAISFGAPFWFDLLNKLIQIRGSGKKPEEEDKTKK